MSSWSRIRSYPPPAYKVQTEELKSSVTTNTIAEAEPPSKQDLIHIQYKKPVCTDTAVIIVFFNPAKSFRMIQNLLYVKQLLERANIPYFIGELAYNDEPHIFSDNSPNIFLYRTSSYMFSKENLIECLLKKSAVAHYSKYVIMDSDIVFENPEWLDAVSSALNTYDVIQPYKYAQRLNLEYKTESIVTSLLAVQKNGHPGYVWAFRRDWWIRTGGLYEYALIGGGDTVFAHLLGITTSTIPNVYMHDLPPVADATTRCSYLPGTIWHLAHGSIVSRQYKERSNKLQHALQSLHITSIHDAVYRTSDGILEWKSEYKDEFNSVLLHYFTVRKDDGV